MTFNRSVVTLGSGLTDAGNFFEVNPNTGIRYSGTGTLVQADTTGVTAWTGDRLLFSQTATPSVNHGFNSSSSSNPLFSFSGAPIGTHTFANSLFDLKGFTTA